MRKLTSLLSSFGHLDEVLLMSDGASVGTNSECVDG